MLPQKFYDFFNRILLEGEINPSKVLSEIDVEEIRKLYDCIPSKFNFLTEL